MIEQRKFATIGTTLAIWALLVTLLYASGITTAWVRAGSNAARTTDETVSVSFVNSHA